MCGISAFFRMGRHTIGVSLFNFIRPFMDAYAAPEYIYLSCMGAPWLAGFWEREKGGGGFDANES